MPAAPPCSPAKATSRLIVPWFCVGTQRLSLAVRHGCLLSIERRPGLDRAVKTHMGMRLCLCNSGRRERPGSEKGMDYRVDPPKLGSDIIPVHHSHFRVHLTISPEPGASTAVRCQYGNTFFVVSSEVGCLILLQLPYTIVVFCTGR
jgi:hypothetical protein